MILRPTQTQTPTQTPTPKDMACEFDIWKMGSVTCDMKGDCLKPLHISDVKQ